MSERGRQRVPGASRGRYPSAPPGSTAVVAGGGLAGLAAATVLAERGVRVTLVEREPVLGGRAGAWRDRLADGTPFDMERGFHAFFRQYYNLRALLRRIDPALDHLAPLADYPILGPDGARESFFDLPTRAPFNVAALVSRTSTLGWRQLLQVDARHASQMLAFDPERTYARWDHESAKEYLDALRFPEHARRMLFEVFAHSFFNPEEHYSAAELLMQFHFYFLGNREGLVFDVMRSPFSRTVFHPLREYLQLAGAQIRLGESVQRVEQDRDGRWTLQLAGGGRVRGDVAVLALSVPGLRRVMADSPPLGTPDWHRAVGALEVTRPFAVWRLWLDRPVRNDRDAFVGTAGLGLIDNISLYHLFEDEARQWAERTGGSVVELHAYAVPENTSEAHIRDELLQALYGLYPETREAQVLDERFMVRRDCPAFPPGTHAQRPGVETPQSTLVLAGDFVRLPFPSALMERAVASGFVAANRLLERWDVRGEPLWSVPRRGLLARAHGSGCASDQRG